MSKLSTQILLKHVCSSNEYATQVAPIMAEGSFFESFDIYFHPLDTNSKEYLSGIKDALKPKNWKRCSKGKIFMEHEHYRMGRAERFYDIGVGDFGEINEPLLAKALEDWKTSGQIKKYLPVHRTFAFTKDMGADYMMDIWTTYDDTEIIGWSVQSD